jgi:hypothetical protein
MIDIDGKNLIRFRDLCESCGVSRCRSCNPVSPKPYRIAWKMYVLGRGAKPDCVAVDNAGNYYCTERKEK